jgi:phosphoribosylformylglycinamidine (FGAM) synthase-like enzyme
MPPNIELDLAVTTLEQRLGALGEALRVHHAEAVACEADALNSALSAAVEQLRRSARAGALPPQLRQRLAVASGRVAAQREALARATATLDRAIEVLLPAATSRGAYSAAGIAERQPHGGMLQA